MRVINVPLDYRDNLGDSLGLGNWLWLRVPLPLALLRRIVVR